MSDRLTTIRQTLEVHQQDHLLRFVDDISEAQRVSLLDQIEQIDFGAIDELIDKYVRHRPELSIPKSIAPASYYSNNAGSHARPFDEPRFRTMGETHLRQGKVAAFCVAGGQGTRLGWNGPKGTFPATVVTGKPLFRVFAEQILAAQKRYGVSIPWYIMTSPINDADTRSFFSDNNCFGLNRRNIFMFPQGVMPSFDASSGRILLAAKDEIAVSPDGHGGSLKALRTSGAIEDMASRGIETISYFQVDNPLVKIFDPVFLGLHMGADDSSGEMSSKMVPKAYPEEKVGVFCNVKGKTTVIEYSDLPLDLARERDESGQLRFIAGSIAIHLLGVDFVSRLTADGRLSLPWHRADKIVPCIDLESGEIIEPAAPNGVKLEAFVFDALPLASSSIVLETSRSEEFAPIKNADGVDSPSSSHQLQTARAAAWLEANGVSIPRDGEGHVNARIEISPLTALGADDLANVTLPTTIRPGDEVSL